MKLQFLLFLFLFVSISTKSQNIDDLEKDISHTTITDTKKIKEKAGKILSLDPYNEIAISYLTTSYKWTNLPDSVIKLFDRIKSVDKNNPKPYILSAKYQFQKISLSDTNSLEELKKAVKLDSNNFEGNQLIGVCYYKLWIEAVNQNLLPKAKFYAKQSKSYLLKTATTQNSNVEIYKYPVIQLSDFLEEPVLASSLMNTIIDDTIQVDSWYFPVYNYLDLPKNWKTDIHLDLLHNISYSSFILDWYSKQLKALEEPIIYNQKNKIIYRFTWLRTFHNPIAIRIEKSTNDYTLFWKVTDGAGGYEPGELIVNKSKKLSESEWNHFIDLINTADFWKLPLKDENLGHDGSRWIIEGREEERYHVADRWTPEKSDFKNCALYLLQLTDLKIPKSKMY